jgi:hypothetical protein
MERGEVSACGNTKGEMKALFVWLDLYVLERWQQETELIVQSIL